jgi:hypothetical protein
LSCAGEAKCKRTNALSISQECFRRSITHQNLALHSEIEPQFYARDMHYFDINIWGLLALPVGLTLCFGPALLVWVKEEFFSSDSKTPDKH